MLIVRTKNGIETNTQDDFLNFDSKNTAQIKAFQNWLDVKYPTWLNGGKLNKGAGYGSYGSKTKAAYAKYGAEFDAAFGALAQNLSTPAVSTAEITNIQAQINDPAVSAAKKEELKKKLTALYQKGQESGLFDIVGGFLKDKLGLNQNTGGSYGTESYGTPDYSGSYPTEKKGLSTGAMIGIGVGAVAIIGLVVYLANKGKSK